MHAPSDRLPLGLRPCTWPGFRAGRGGRSLRPVDLHIDDDHVALLRDVLDAALRDVRFEIADTDNAHYKQQLRGRESQLRVLLEPLGGPLPDLR